MKLLDKLKNWYSAAALALGKGVFLFLLLNLLLYLVSLARRPPIKVDALSRYGSDKLQKAYPGWREEDVRILLRETYREGNFEYEPFTEFRDRPFQGKYLNVDPAGFRVSKDQAPWPPRPEATNLFVFGGSTTFGYSLPDNQTIASHLGECGLANSPGGRLAVYNFGRGAYFSSQELILFQQLLKAGFVPSIAVFIDGLNDFGLPDGEPYFANKFRRLMAGQAQVGSSPLENVPVVKAAHWLRDRWKKPQPEKAADGADPAVQERVIHRWLANKRMIEVMADAFGVWPIFVWQPVPTYKYDLRYHFLSSGSPFGGHPPPELAGHALGYALMENLRGKRQARPGCSVAG